MTSVRRGDASQIASLCQGPTDSKLFPVGVTRSLSWLQRRAFDSPGRAGCGLGSLKEQTRAGSASVCWRSTVDLCQFSVSRYRSRTRPAVELADFPPSAATQQNTANDFKGKLEMKNDSSLIYVFIFRISFQFIHLFYFLILVHTA